jgi:protein AATF/BFR2
MSNDENDPFQHFDSSDDEDEAQNGGIYGEEEKEDEDDDDDDENGYSDDSDEEMSNPNESNGFRTGFDQKEIAKQFAQDKKAITSNLSQGTKTDIEKGLAIKEQRSTFDKLIGLRLKLQKALISTNSIQTITEPIDALNVIQNAESAAFRLLQTIHSLRSPFIETESTMKRKHASISSSDSIPTIWSKLQTHEATNKKQRNSTLNLWANKTRNTQNLIQQSRLHSSSADTQSLSDVLTSQLNDMPHLISKTTVPRSCAPLQAKDSSLLSSTGLPIYDDADFYRILLQTLVSQRSSDVSIASFLILQP